MLSIIFYLKLRDFYHSNFMIFISNRFKVSHYLNRELACVCFLNLTTTIDLQYAILNL